MAPEKNHHTSMGSHTGMAMPVTFKAYGYESTGTYLEIMYVGLMQNYTS